MKTGQTTEPLLLVPACRTLWVRVDLGLAVVGDC